MKTPRGQAPLRVGAGGSGLPKGTAKVSLSKPKWYRWETAVVFRLASWGLAIHSSDWEARVGSKEIRDDKWKSSHVPSGVKKVSYITFSAIDLLQSHEKFPTSPSPGLIKKVSYISRS